MKTGIILTIAAIAVLLSAAGIVLIHAEDDRDLTWQYMEQYNLGAAELLSGYTDELTLQTASHFALLDAGVTESLLGDYPSYWNCMAEACGVNPDGDPGSKATVKDLKALIDKAEPLKVAIDGGWYDYSICLNSTLYEVREGHHLVAAITPLPIATFFANHMAEEIEDYSFTIDLEGSWVSIPFSPSLL